jgi:hypothetical protein
LSINKFSKYNLGQGGEARRKGVEVAKNDRDFLNFFSMKISRLRWKKQIKVSQNQFKMTENPQVSQGQSHLVICTLIHLLGVEYPSVTQLQTIAMWESPES